MDDGVARLAAQTRPPVGHCGWPPATGPVDLEAHLVNLVLVPPPRPDPDAAGACGALGLVLAAAAFPFVSSDDAGLVDRRGDRDTFGHAAAAAAP